MQVKVFKFGGASVKDEEGFRQVGRIIQEFIDDSLVIVVSALGKTTNAMEEVVGCMCKNNGKAGKVLLKIREHHESIIQHLFGNDHNNLDRVLVDVNRIFKELEQKLEDYSAEEYDYTYDQIVPYGELLSSTMLSYYLKSINLANEWVDVRDIIRTNDTYRDAKIIWGTTQEQVDQKIVPMLREARRIVTQGFIGGTGHNTTTTLGREGSDYTAAILTYCLDAGSMHIWKDVPGVLTGDPRLFSDVILLPRLSYKEAIEMTYYGAKVIHPKTIKPIQNKQIPLYVRPFSDPESTGTLISNERELTNPPIVVIEPNQALLHISTNDFSFVAEHHLGHIFLMLARYRLKVNMMRNTAISFSVCINQVDDRINDFEKELGEEFKLVIEKDLELITILHYNEELITEMKKNKEVLFEEKLPQTVQLVVRNLSEKVLNDKKC